MALQGPFAVIADSPAPDVMDALRAAGAFPIIEATWADAPTALAAVEPEAVILAEPCPERLRAAALADLLGAQRQKGGALYMPVIARTRDDGAPSVPDALAIAANASPQRLVRRLATALRIRSLHGTVLRRMRTLTSRGEQNTGIVDRRSARRSKRAGRRTRTRLSGPFGRGRRAGRRGRRAFRRERGARAQRPRHRRHGDRRRLQPENRRGFIDRGRRGRALSRSAGRGARRSSVRDRAVCHRDRQSRTHRRRPATAGRTLPALCPGACLRPTPQAHAQIARR